MLKSKLGDILLLKLIEDINNKDNHKQMRSRKKTKSNKKSFAFLFLFRIVAILFSFVQLSAAFAGFDAVEIASFLLAGGAAFLAFRLRLERVAADAAKFLPQFGEDLLLNLRTLVDKLTRCVGRHRTLV